MRSGSVRRNVRRVHRRHQRGQDLTRPGEKDDLFDIFTKQLYKSQMRRLFLKEFPPIGTFRPLRSGRRRGSTFSFDPFTARDQCRDPGRIHGRKAIAVETRRAPDGDQIG